MPIHDIRCACGFEGEVITLAAQELPACPACGRPDPDRLPSAVSSLTGRAVQGLPGPKDTACCGSRPGEAACAGPGSCCSGRGA
ncbi:hypothetical protein NNJEOMEG_02302 [Fundidesulfovibrio magnetotacticus]|uniref:Putative regulatory protein FmdB zinc ribbon domain-containing protein n=1 Tax=Fundidesulfovibrio magnetotacticus TaxID=2730080 RepID=A0A6V8LXT2_9BACT|nr:zinc ribbon domain-containing protein [Fundidesulfovibrio magnetotacticus]GFK94457.1 hypothetical protein NNJEOMEG_02302 [Fundidesulfovibrio magnetotacticus]